MYLMQDLTLKKYHLIAILAVISLIHHDHHEFCVYDVFQRCLTLRCVLVQQRSVDQRVLSMSRY